MCSVGEYLRICSRKAHYTFNNNASASHVATHHPQIELNQCHTHSKYRAATSSTIYLSSWWVGRRLPPTNRCLNKPTLHRDRSQPASEAARTRNRNPISRQQHYHHHKQQQKQHRHQQQKGEDNGGGAMGLNRNGSDTQRVK